MTRTALEGFGKTLLAGDKVVLETTGNSIGGVAGSGAIPFRSISAVSQSAGVPRLAAAGVWSFSFVEGA